MGPRSGDRGQRPHGQGFIAPITWLQWVHDPEIVVNPHELRNYFAAFSLQWVHDPEIVVNPAIPTAPSMQAFCFNGSTIRRSWSTRSTASEAPARQRFNGSTIRRSWSTKSKAMHEDKRILASMGPR